MKRDSTITQICEGNLGSAGHVRSGDGTAPGKRNGGRVSRISEPRARIEEESWVVGHGADALCTPCKATRRGASTPFVKAQRKQIGGAFLEPPK